MEVDNLRSRPKELAQTNYGVAQGTEGVRSLVRRAISLLRRYAAWRYGGEGDAATLAAELEEAAL